MRQQKDVRRFDGAEVQAHGSQESDQHHAQADKASGEIVEGPRRLTVTDIPAHPNNYGDRPAGMPITLIVLHYTATGSLDAAVNWFKSPEAKVSAHYVIGQQGEIVRMVHEVKNAYHAGRSAWNGHHDVNRFSIGIELVNWGKLIQRDGRFFTWPNDYTNSYYGSNPVFLEGDWWEPFPDTQLASLQLLLSDIQKRHPVEAIVGHRDVSPSRKVDPGPALRLPSTPEFV